MKNICSLPRELHRTPLVLWHFKGFKKKEKTPAILIHKMALPNVVPILCLLRGKDVQGPMLPVAYTWHLRVPGRMVNGYILKIWKVSQKYDYTNSLFYGNKHIPSPITKFCARKTLLKPTLCESVSQQSEYDLFLQWKIGNECCKIMEDTKKTRSEVGCKYHCGLGRPQAKAVIAGRLEPTLNNLEHVHVVQPAREGTCGRLRITCAH